MARIIPKRSGSAKKSGGGTKDLEDQPYWEHSRARAPGQTHRRYSFGNFRGNTAWGTSDVFGRGGLSLCCAAWQTGPGHDVLKGDTPQGFAREVFHVHVRYLGDWDELYFRDYLRQFPRKAAEYEALKRRLQVKYTHDRDAYTKAKGSFIKSTTALARKHFGAKYRPGAAQGRQLG